MCIFDSTHSTFYYPRKIPLWDKRSTFITATWPAPSASASLLALSPSVFLLYVYRIYHIIKHDQQMLITPFKPTGPVLLHIIHYNPSSAATSNSDNRRPLPERSEAPNPPICPSPLLPGQFLLLFRMVPLISTPSTPIHGLAVGILYNQCPRCWFLVQPSPRLQELGLGCDPRRFPLLPDPGLQHK